MADHKPGVQQSELDGRDHKKVHCGDPMSVIVKKRLPSLALIVVRISFHPGQTCDRKTQKPRSAVD